MRSVSLAHDSSLPADTSLLLICGQPEAAPFSALCANSAMRRAIVAFASAGGAIYAEGTGLAYLSQAVRCRGTVHSMSGVLPAHTVLHSEVQASGNVQLRSRPECKLLPDAAELRGCVHTRLETRLEVATQRLGLATSPPLQEHSEVQHAFDAILVDAQQGAHDRHSDSAAGTAAQHSVPEGLASHNVLATVASVAFASNVSAAQHMLTQAQAVDTAATAAAMHAASVQPGRASSACQQHAPSPAHNSQQSHGLSAASSFSSAQTPQSTFSRLQHNSSSSSSSKPRHSSLGPADLVSSNQLSLQPSTSLPRQHSSLALQLSARSSSIAQLPPQRQLARSQTLHGSRSAAGLRHAGSGVTGALARRPGAVWPPRVNGHVRLIDSQDLEAMQSRRSTSFDATGAAHKNGQDTCVQPLTMSGRSMVAVHLAQASSLHSGIE